MRSLLECQKLSEDMYIHLDTIPALDRQMNWLNNIVFSMLSVIRILLKFLFDMLIQNFSDIIVSC